MIEFEPGDIVFGEDFGVGIFDSWQPGCLQIARIRTLFRGGFPKKLAAYNVYGVRHAAPYDMLCAGFIAVCVAYADPGPVHFATGEMLYYLSDYSYWRARNPLDSLKTRLCKKCRKIIDLLESSYE